MKKLIILFLTSIVISNSIKAQTYSTCKEVFKGHVIDIPDCYTYNFMYDTISTPFCTPVKATFQFGEYTDYARNYFDSLLFLIYPNVEQIIQTYGGHSATRKFNCNGYAWVMDGVITDNTLLYRKLGVEVLSFMTDGSYTKVNGWHHPAKVYMSKAEHSAITTNSTNIVISKWGEYPLVEHNLYYSMYNITSNEVSYWVKTTSLEVTGLEYVSIAGTSFKLNASPLCPVQWSVTGPFTITTNPNNSASVTVTYTGVNNNSGTLTATMNGVTIQGKTIYPATEIFGADVVCYDGSVFTLSNPPGVPITWTVSNTGLFTVPTATGNSTTVTRTGSGVGSATLYARTGGVNGTVVDSKTITACAPPTISGPNVVCSTSTFTVSNAPAGFTWDKSSNVTLSGSGSSVSVSKIADSRSPGWVSIKNSSGVELVRKTFWVGTPATATFKYGPSSDFILGGRVLLELHPDNNAVTNGSQWVIETTDGWWSLQSQGTYYRNIDFFRGTYTIKYNLTNVCGAGIVSQRTIKADYVGVYPNPVSHELNIEFSETWHGIWQVYVYNSASTLMTGFSTYGPSEYIDVSGYPNGIYYLHITAVGSGQPTGVIKIVKQ